MGQDVQPRSAQQRPRRPTGVAKPLSVRAAPLPEGPCNFAPTRLSGAGSERGGERDLRARRLSLALPLIARARPRNRPRQPFEPCGLRKFRCRAEALRSDRSRCNAKLPRLAPQTRPSRYSPSSSTFRLVRGASIPRFFVAGPSAPSCTVLAQLSPIQLAAKVWSSAATVVRRADGRRELAGRDG